MEQSIGYFLLGGDRNNGISIKDGNEEVEVLIPTFERSQKIFGTIKI